MPVDEEGEAVTSDQTGWYDRDLEDFIPKPLAKSVGKGQKKKGGKGGINKRPSDLDLSGLISKLQES
eukprot:2696516-Pyramimonas_sp.AAC.1